jgi:hypothetical protein
MRLLRGWLRISTEGGQVKEGEDGNKVRLQRIRLRIRTQGG